MIQLGKLKYTLTLSALFALFSFGVLTILLPAQSSAVNASDWKPGRIIDDAVFFNKDAMNPSQIQQFLNSKVPVCDTNHNASFTYNGVWNAPPYTCLKDYNQNGRSAAQIIYDAGQTYGINPQVILTMLQKETALVTDTWAAPWQYDRAMGYACPDTAACNTAYYGFTNQVNSAARQLRAYVNYPDYYNFKAGVTRNILWSPNTACGSNPVYIETQGTAALYNYTPYQPNQAALNNMYGLGDGCSAYGNRNFWRLFNDWFGTTQTNTSVSNINWNFEALDGKPVSVSKSDGDFGKYPNSITYNNLLHEFYYDSSSGNLRHAWADVNGWHFETLDGEGGDNGRVNADVGMFTKATEYDGKLYISYYSPQKHSLRIGYLDNSGWHFETLDGEGGDNGRVNADVGQDIAMSHFGDSLQLYYFDATNSNLRHAWADVNGWHFENLDGSADSVSRKDSFVGQSPTVTVYGGTLQLFYYDAQAGNLRHAWANGSGWHFENLDGDGLSISRQSGNVGIRPLIVADEISSILHVYYFDADINSLKQSWSDNSGWHFAYIDGNYSAISKDNTPIPHDSPVAGSVYNGSVQLFYRVNNDTYIKHAWGFPK